MGFNSGFKGLRSSQTLSWLMNFCPLLELE